MAKSVTLSAYFRQAIIKSMKQSSKPRKALEDLNVKAAELGLEVRDWTLGKHKDVYLNLPKNLQGVARGIHIDGIPLIGKRFCLGFNESNPAPVHSVVFSDLPKKLQSKLEKYVQIRQKLNAEYSEFSETLEGIVSGVNTTKQLLEIFPECESHFPLELKARMQGAGLPAIPNTLINNLRNQLQA